MNRTIITLLCLISPFAFAEESAVPPVEIEASSKAARDAEITQKVLEASKAVGVLMAKSIQSTGMNYDTDKIVQGFKDTLQGNETLTSDKCMEIVAHAQEAVFKKLASENLKKTEDFLAQNKSIAGIKEIEANKLQYKVEKEGSGPAVEEKNTPLVRYTAKFLDEIVDDSSKEEIRINLEEEELVPGFKRALIGMKEGEKRTVYIHPDLSFKTQDFNRFTNSLLTFEIEVVKANAPAQQPIDSLSNLPTNQGNFRGNPEIASPLEDRKDIR